MFFLFYLFILLSGALANNCSCAINSTAGGKDPLWTYPWGTEPVAKCSLDMQMDCQNQISWVYYLQQPNPEIHLVNILISILFIPECNNTECLAEVFTYFSNDDINLFETNFELIHTGESFHSHTNNTSIKRIKSQSPGLQVNVKNQSYFWADGRGMFPQGYNGFVRSGEKKCSTAYSCSFLRTQGIKHSYGEFVHGSFIDKEAVPWWACFYFHINLLADIQLCSDPINLKYNRAHIAFYNQTYVSIQGKEVINWIKGIKAWHSTKSNQWYQIEWQIDIPLLDILPFQAISYPSVVQQSEHCLNNECFWIGATNLKIDNISIGDGITEVFNFSNSKDSFLTKLSYFNKGF